MIKIAILIVLVLLDLITKYIVKLNIDLNQYILVNSFISIVFVQNFGVSFGLFSNVLPSWFLILIASLVTLMIIYLSLISKNLYEKRAYFLLIVGAISNIVDRCINGYVIDFISLNYKNFYWPAFNLADIYITLGIIMLIMSFFILKQNNEA